MIEIDTHSAVPPYEQIRSQLTRLIATGALPPGTRLPSIRQLAGDLGLAINTVGRAYRELENDGVLISRGKRGSFIAEEVDAKTPPDSLVKERGSVLAAAAVEYATIAHRLGYGLRQATEALEKAMVSTSRDTSRDQRA